MKPRMSYTKTARHTAPVWVETNLEDCKKDNVLIQDDANELEDMNPLGRVIPLPEEEERIRSEVNKLEKLSGVLINNENPPLTNNFNNIKRNRSELTDKEKMDLQFKHINSQLSLLLSRIEGVETRLNNLKYI